MTDTAQGRRITCATCGRDFDTTFPMPKECEDMQIAIEHLNPSALRPNVIHKIILFFHDPIPAQEPGKGDK